MSREFLKKAAAVAAAKENDYELEDKEFEKGWPNLYGFITCNVGVAEGTARQRASISFFAEGGRWKAALHDKETDASIFVTMDRPKDLFDALEQALEADKPDWRRWKGKARR